MLIAKKNSFLLILHYETVKYVAAALQCAMNGAHQLCNYTVEGISTSLREMLESHHHLQSTLVNPTLVNTEPLLFDRHFSAQISISLSYTI